MQVKCESSGLLQNKRRTYFWHTFGAIRRPLITYTWKYVKYARESSFMVPQGKRFDRIATNLRIKTERAYSIWKRSTSNYFTAFVCFWNMLCQRHCQRGVFSTMNVLNLLLCLVKYCFNSSISPWTKWPSFRRRHFQMYFHESKVLYFDWDFTKVYFYWSNWQ